MLGGTFFSLLVSTRYYCIGVKKTSDYNKKRDLGFDVFMVSDGRFLHQLDDLVT